MADEHFDVLLTADSGLPFQQNLAGRRLAVVAIAAKSNRFGDLQPMMDRVRDAIRRATGGNVVRVGD